MALLIDLMNEPLNKIKRKVTKRIINIERVKFKNESFVSDSIECFR